MQDIIDPIKEALTCLDNNNIAAFKSFIQLKRAHPVRQFVLFLAATYGAIEFLQVLTFYFDAHLLMLKETAFLQLLLDVGADVNTPIGVRISLP